MSTLKSVNWSLAWRRSIWTLVWAAMMALLVVMCIDLAAHQPVIFGIVLLAAFVGSIGLAYTRISWQNGATATACAALVVALLAIATHAFMEASYWSSVIDQINQEVMAERAVSDARAAVAEKRKERYVSSSNGRSASQIAAEIKASETNVLFTRSASCTNATAQDSRDFCQGYFLLQAKYAAAKEASQLEGIIWSAGTTVETTTKRNLASIAVMASNIFGGQPEQYTAIIVITLVLFTQALLAFALVIGWAPEKARERATAAKATEATATAVSLPSPAVALPRTPMAHLEKVAGVKAEPVSDSYTLLERVKEIEKNEHVRKNINQTGKILSDLSDKPDGDGTPMAEPEPVDDVTTEPVRNVVSLFRDDGKGPEARRSKKKAHKPEGKVEAWLAASTSQVDDPAVRTTSEECWKSYLAYCGEDKQPLHRKVFSRKLGALVGRQTGRRNERDKNGSVYRGLLIAPVYAARRRVA